MSFNGVTKGITVTECGIAKPRQDRISIRHPSCSAENFRCHSASASNLLRALNERVFNVEGKSGLEPTPASRPGVWLRLQKIQNQLARLVRESAEYVQRLTVDEFVEQCPAQKRALYTRAGEEFKQRGCGKRDSLLKAFVKFEKIKFEKSGRKADPCPRLIQPRSPVFNVALGRYTRRIEDELYKALSVVWDAEEGEIVVMKGITGEEMAAQLRRKWDSFDCPVALLLDATRFDQHVGVDALKFEHGVYNGIFRGTLGADELKGLLKEQVDNRGVAYLDGYKIEYKIKGTRSSGDMNTGCGNCTIMSSLGKLFCDELGVKCKFANNGDDCVLFCEKRDYKRIQSKIADWFLDFGFNIKVEEPAFEFEHVEFCQMRPVWSGHEWVMCRSVRNAMSKDTMCLGAKCEQYKQWIHAVGTAGRSLYGDMPIFSSLYSRMVQCGTPSNVRFSNTARNTGLFVMAYNFRGRKCAPTVNDECRVSFAKAFGISPEQQLAVEAELGTLSFDGLDRAHLGTEVALL